MLESLLAFKRAGADGVADVFCPGRCARLARVMLSVSGGVLRARHSGGQRQKQSPIGRGHGAKFCAAVMVRGADAKRRRNLTQRVLLDHFWRRRRASHGGAGGPGRVGSGFNAGFCQFLVPTLLAVRVTLS